MTTEDFVGSYQVKYEKLWPAPKDAQLGNIWKKKIKKKQSNPGYTGKKPLKCKYE